MSTTKIYFILLPLLQPLLTLHMPFFDKSKYFKQGDVRIKCPIASIEEPLLKLIFINSKCCIGKFGDLDIDVHNVYKVELPIKLFDRMKVRIVVFNDREDANTLPATSGQ